jgi:hypothetical protein
MRLSTSLVQTASFVRVCAEGRSYGAAIVQDRLAPLALLYCISVMSLVRLQQQTFARVGNVCIHVRTAHVTRDV